MGWAFGMVGFSVVFGMGGFSRCIWFGGGHKQEGERNGNLSKGHGACGS